MNLNILYSTPNIETSENDWEVMKLRFTGQ